MDTSSTVASAGSATPVRPVLTQGPNRWPGLLVLGAMILFFAPLYISHARLAANPAALNASARQQFWPVLRYYNEQLFQTDEIANYFLASFPIGFKAIYSTIGSVIDPRALGHLLTYVLLAITVWAAARAARRVRGPAAGWATAVLALSATLYLDRMTGGLPRAFAFPFLAIAMLALARGKAILLAGVVILAAGFYPVVSVVTGIALAVWLLLFPASARGNAEHWGIGRRVMLTVVAALGATAMILPTIQATAEWGPVLRASKVTDYPEMAKGPYQIEDRTTNAFTPQGLKNFIEAPLAGIGGQWSPADHALHISPRQIALMALLVLGLIGFALLLKPSPPARRVLLMPVAAIAAYVLAALVAPTLYLPARYQLYPLAVAALVMVPAGIAHLATVIFRHANQRRTQALFMIATVGVVVVLFSGYRYVSDEQPGFRYGDLATAGLDPTPDPHQGAYQFLSKLWPGSRVAGWPSDLDSVQYLTGRSALATRDAHQTFHQKYADMMRTRVNAVIAALYDRDPASLIRLRDEFGVSHVIVDRGLYGPAAPNYFPPFDERANAARAALGDEQPATLSQSDRAAVYSDKTWVILDLNRLR